MRTVLVVVLAVTSSTALAATGSVPVVVALDTSRSVSAVRLQVATDRVVEALNALQGGTPCGLLEFNDAPVWGVPAGGSIAEVSAALGRSRPNGRHTALRDALIVSARAFERGGVILLVSDGRDEQSAATAGDVAQFLAARNVRVVSLGLGRKIDERALRRVSLLSGGEYLGHVDQVSPGLVAAGVENARASLAELFVEPVAPVLVATPAPAADEPQPERSGSRGWLVWALAGGILVVVVGAVALLVASRRRAENSCPDCGREMASWERECSFCKLDRLQLERVEKATPQAAPEELQTSGEEAALFDESLFEKAVTDEQLERTFALQERPLIIVRENRKPTRSFVLDESRVVGVGRAHVNTIVLEDGAVSAQHFKIVPRDGEFFVLDLDSTNGTFVNGERVRVHRLRPGDVVSSGQAELEFRVEVVRPPARAS